MSKKDLRVKIGEVKTEKGTMKDLEISIGRIFEEEWEEPVGPTPFPSIKDLRNWDFKLLKRYKPFYMPFCDLCCFCTYGKCDLTKNKRGACGIDMAGQQARIVLLACAIGAATHCGHARHLVEHLIEEYGRDTPLSMGENVEIEAPHVRLVCGIRPRKIKDLEIALDYVENQVTHLLSAIHTGQEGHWMDFESKVFHAGMIDHVAMEIADIAQIAVYNFPKADPDAPLVELGAGVVDSKKPTILVVGHNVPPAIAIADYLTKENLVGSVEVAGLCCTAIDLTRYSSFAKIIGPMSWTLRFIRSGLADVIVVDEQCVRTNLVEEAKKIGALFIATSEKNCQGLPNRTNDPADQIVDDLVSGKQPGVLIFDTEKVGEVAVKAALAVAPKRKKKRSLLTPKEIIEGSKKCIKCQECIKACPDNLPVMYAVNDAARGDLSKLAELYEKCIGCARCESACSVNLPLHTYIISAAEKKMTEEKFKIRAGRGPISDIEIREVGQPIVFGEIPGVVAFVGCPNYANGGKEIPEMVDEFAKRRYIITLSGCAAMTAGMFKDEEGKTVYEKYHGRFDAGGVVNVGSCVSNPHISGAAIKIARIFAKRNIRANYEEIADYVYNRIGAVGVAWGAMSQKAASIASGFWRLGVPVIVGPHGSKYRRMLLGRKDRDEDWYVWDARTGKKVYVGPAPEHLFYTAETKEEAMVMIAKLCIRPNDTTKGRAIKLTHYIDLYKKFYGKLPDDIHLYVRTKADIPLTMKDEILAYLEAKGWKEKATPDPTLLPRLIRKKEG